ncbi:efflux RND transporter periplasmic adaptor subunit [candidate division KSB1 bacterium]
MRTPLSIIAVPAVVMVVIAVLVSACGSSDGGSARITRRVVQGDFTHTLEVDGVIEAQRNHVLMAPRIGPPWPEIAYLIPEGTMVDKGDTVITFGSERYQQNLQTAVRNLDIAQSDLDKSDADQALRRAQLEAAIKSSEKEAEASRLQLVRLDFVAPRVKEIKTLQIERAEKRAEQSRNKLLASEEVYVPDRAARELEIKQLRNQVSRAEENLEKLALRAPARGSVIHHRDWRRGGALKEGDTVHPRMPLLQIPDRGSMIVTLSLSETDVQSLQVDQAVTITIPSLDNQRLTGRVSSVARMARPVQRNSRVKWVQVIIEVTSADFPTTPGLTARCSIVLEEVAEALIIPLDCVFNQDSLQVVYIRRQGVYEQRPVTLGRKSGDFAVVRSGLEGGEELVLNEPPRSKIKLADMSALDRISQ